MNRKQAIVAPLMAAWLLLIGGLSLGSATPGTPTAGTPGLARMSCLKCPARQSGSVRRSTRYVSADEYQCLACQRNR